MKALKVFLVLIFLNTTGYSYTSHPDSVVVFDDLRLALKKVYQKPDTSLLLVNRAIKICKQNNYPFGLMKSLNLKGICYDILGKNDSALTQYYIAKKLALKLNDPNSIAQITTNIGLIYWNQNRLDSAIFCYTNIDNSD